MFGLITTILTLFAGAAVIYAAILSVNAVANWFRNRQAMVQSDRNNIAFTIRERLNSGSYNVYQGVFNTSSQQLLDGQKIEVEKLDDELEQLHRNEDMVVFQ